MRGSFRGGGGFPSRGRVGALKVLLLCLCGVFVLQSLLEVWLGRSAFLVNYFALSLDNVEGGKWWVLVSYSFLHGGLWHLLGNGLIIFFAFNALREALSDSFLLKVYVFGVLSGGFLCLFTQYLGMSTYVLGASAGALSLLSLYCLLYPERTVVFLLFFVIPVRLKPKWVFWFLVCAESFGFLFEEIPVALGRAPLYAYSNIAYAGHLGGILVGVVSFFMLRGGLPSYLRGLSFRRFVPAPHRPYRVRVAKRGEAKGDEAKRDEAKRGEAKRGEAKRGGAARQARLDEILEKISARGFSSLTEEERAFIERVGK